MIPELVEPASACPRSSTDRQTEGCVALQRSGLTVGTFVTNGEVAALRRAL